MEQNEAWYNVHLNWPDGMKEKIAICAISKASAKFHTRIDNAVVAGATVRKVIGPLGKEATAKQKLAQRYGFIIGGIMGAQSSFNYTKSNLFPNGVDAEKAKKAFALVDSQ